jgi:hypothetical protein
MLHAIPNCFFSLLIRYQFSKKSGHFLQVKQTAAVLITYMIVLFQHINGSRDLAEQLVAIIKMATIFIIKFRAI